MNTPANSLETNREDQAGQEDVKVLPNLVKNISRQAVSKQLSIASFSLDRNSPGNNNNPQPNRIEEGGKQLQQYESSSFRSFPIHTPTQRFIDSKFLQSDEKVPQKIAEQYSLLYAFAQVKEIKLLYQNHWNPQYISLLCFKKNLSSRVNEIVSKSEEDFLIVYQEQMKLVLTELHKLKKRIENEDIQLQKDEKMFVLSEERNYYRREALRLDKLCREAEKERDELSFQNKEFRNDISHYESVLISIILTCISNETNLNDVFMILFIEALKKENKEMKIELLHLYDHRKSIPQDMKEKLKSPPSSLHLLSPKQPSSQNFFPTEQQLSLQPKNNPESKPGSSSSRFNSNHDSTHLPESRRDSPSKRLTFAQQLIKQGEPISVRRSRSIKTTENKINELLQENANLRAQTDLLRQNNIKLKRILAERTCSQNTIGTEQQQSQQISMPESIKEAQKEILSRKQLNQLTSLFKKGKH